jgi:hypothetical protein
MYNHYTALDRSPVQRGTIRNSTDSTAVSPVVVLIHPYVLNQYLNKVINCILICRQALQLIDQP